MSVLKYRVSLKWVNKMSAWSAALFAPLSWLRWFLSLFLVGHYTMNSTIFLSLSPRAWTEGQRKNGIWLRTMFPVRDQHEELQFPPKMWNWKHHQKLLPRPYWVKKVKFAADTHEDLNLINQNIIFCLSLGNIHEKNKRIIDFNEILRSVPGGNPFESFEF